MMKEDGAVLDCFHANEMKPGYYCADCGAYNPNEEE